MSDLISRRTVIDMVEGWNLNQHIMNEEDALDDVKALPSAEPQIIRCKDCRWWTKHDTTLQGKCKLHGLNPMPEWYCASGAVVE